MQIEINVNIKLVSIWLTKSEAKDENLREGLKPLYSKYKEKKYKVAVFESGENEDLLGLTTALLKDNKYKLYKDDSEENDNKAAGF